MLKREITYEDYDGKTVTDTFYFNLSKTELLDLELKHEGGLEAAINRVIETKDVKALIAEFKDIVLASYGVKSEDGKRFVKNDSLREEFAQTAAYDALFIELATDADAAAAFVRGIVPFDIAETPPVENVPLPPTQLPPPKPTE